MDYNLLQLRHRAEPCQNDLDGQFIFLWLAFHAAYDQDLACLNVSEAASFPPLVSKICDLDQNTGLTKRVSQGCPSGMYNMGDILTVFDNRMM
jgi:hypothetical protein